MSRWSAAEPEQGLGRLLGSLKHWQSQREGLAKGRWRPGFGKRSQHGEMGVMGVMGVMGERLPAHTNSKWVS